MRRVVIISGGGVLAVTLGVVGIFLYSQTSQTDEVIPTRPGTMSLNSSPEGSSGSLNSEERTVPLDDNSSQQSSSNNTSAINLQGDVAGTTNSDVAAGSSDNGKKSAPGPEEFSIYDKYKTDQTTLMGDMIVGNGAEAKAGSILTVNYRGWLTNGKLFDESYSRGQPFTFTIGEQRVIPGWEAGFMGMKAGGKRRLIVPPASGYGKVTQGSIPPDSVLVFDVELLKVQ